MPSQDEEQGTVYCLGRVMPDQVVTVFAVTPDGGENDLVGKHGEHSCDVEGLIHFLQVLREQGLPIPPELDEAAYAAFT